MNSHLPPSCTELRRRLRALNAPRHSRKLTFTGTSGRDVYNITAPFHFDGEELLAGRVENRDTELSTTMLFRERDGVWEPRPGAPIFEKMQDPCVTFVGDELVFGGVMYPIPMADGGQGWHMCFYRGRSLDTLQPFLTGPDMMKDIRLKQLRDERIAVLTRPHLGHGGRGKIGMVIVDSLEAITSAAIDAAPLFELCQAEEWVGANEAHLLANGKLGVLGHIACFDSQEARHYYPMVFCVDPATGRTTLPRIIAERADFPAGPAKRPDLVDIIFSGGLVRHGDGTATFYGGLSDAEAACLTLADPLTDYEA